MCQSNPHVLKKLYGNFHHLKSILSPDDELLDVGCGEGHVYRRLEHKKYTGIDLFPENIASARAQFPEGRFEVGDLFDLSGKWDVVLCCRVLMHLPDFEKAVNILRGCARKATVLMIPLGADACEADIVKGRKVYFRTFSTAMVRAIGECEIIKHIPYSTVIYRG